MLIAPAVEYSIFHAIFNGELDYTEVDRKSLSHTGQVLYRAIGKLSEGGGQWDTRGVLTVAGELFGLDKTKLEDYMINVEKFGSTNGKDIYGLLKERSALLNISNEIQRQMTSGDLDLSKLQIFMSSGFKKQSDELVAVENDLAAGAPDPPTGPKLISLPKISACTNGVFGLQLWAGLPGLGKSTMALQIAGDLSLQNVPILYYDRENGKPVMLHRLVSSRGLEQARRMGRHLYLRESLRTLSRDIAKIKPPCLIVVDSIQKVPTSGDDKREGLDSWIHRFEEIKKEGYSVILVSEINRASYSGVPKLDAFKESGALEYAADAAFCLVERDGGMRGVWIVKNRHYEHTGMVATVERSSSFWFREINLEGAII